MVTSLSTYTCCTLYGELMAESLVMYILRSNGMLLFILASSGRTDDFEMCILGHIVGGCVGTIAVD